MNLRNTTVLRAKKAKIGRLPVEDSFFDSLREDYPGFDDWLRRKSEEDCYASYTGAKGAGLSIEAFLYLKLETATEDYSSIIPVFEPSIRLKVGTFKVSRKGVRLGERFLKLIFESAFQNKVNEIYVTIFDRTDEQKALIGLMVKWGFEHWGYKGKEQVYVRPFLPQYHTEDPRKCYPFLQRETTFIVPIYPDYHTKLFPDSILNSESPFDYQEDSPFGNAIEKVYISRSQERKLQIGDLVVFYRTATQGETAYYSAVISTLCVVAELPIIPNNFHDFSVACGDRSVFSEVELEEFWNFNPRSRPFVVKLLHVSSFKPRPNRKSLIENGIFASLTDAPRGFEKLSKEKFSTILKLANVDEGYFID